MSTSSIKLQIRRFHVVVVQWTSKKCTKKRDARAELLFWSLIVLFFEVVVERRRRSCLSSLMSLSKDVFGRGTSTGSESFSLLICLDANKFVFLRIFSLTESICLNIWSKSRPKIGKKSTSGWRASLKKIVFQTPYFWTPIRFGMVHVDKEHL